MADLDVRILTAWDEVEALASVWNDLLPSHPQRSLFSSIEWLRVWWRHWGAGKELRVVVIEERGQPVAVVPLMRVARNRGPVRFHALEIIGTGDVEFVNLALPPDRVDVLDLFVNTLIREMNDWEILWLTELDAQDAALAALKSALAKRGIPSDIQPTARCPYLVLDRPFEELYRALTRSRVTPAGGKCANC